MEPATVIGLVTALVETYADGLEDYTTWKAKRSASNRYEGRGRPGTFCALATTLAVSGPQIKETYDNALFVIGSELSTGDSFCRSLLWAQLNVLSHCVASLHRAAASTSALVDISNAIRICENVRRASLQGLGDQYQRLALGRPIPKTLAIPRPRVWAHERIQQSREAPKESNDESGTHEVVITADEDDKMTTAMTVCSGPLRFQSEPPSPPPTPKAPDTMSELSGPVSGPTKSVFALFCPEAMPLQVNLKLPLPARSKCSCGYRWRATPTAPAETFLLKEGFKLTDRYLAKSHLGATGYGCVLCTSSGRSERYEGVEHLRDHINTSHSKWQLLHDVDCRTGCSASASMSLTAS